MAQFIVQADDIAITHGTTLGIIDAIRNGIVRNTGIFTNRPDAAFAAEALADIPGIDIGIDINFVTGAPVLPASEVPDLVTETGSFRSSGRIRVNYREISRDGLYADYEPEPFDHDQALAEGTAQVERYLQLFGHRPAYIHHHSLVSVGSDAVLHELADEYELLVVDDLFRFGTIPLLPNAWYTTPFGLAAQADADPVASLLPHIDTILDNDVTALITHPGYVDAELIDVSSYNVIRARDLQLVTSKDLIARLVRAGVEFVSFSAAGIQRSH